MSQWAVWFAVISFTLMFAAFAFSFMGYLADRKPWLRSYLLYFASFALWLLLATWLYFSTAFVPGDHAGLDLAIGWIRVGISMVIGFVSPLVVVQLKHGRASPRQLILLAIPPVVLLAGIIAYLRTAQPLISTILNICFNGFMCAVAAWGIVVLKKAVPDPRAATLRAFFRLSVVLYALLVLFVAGASLLKSTIVLATNVLLSALFGLSWSVLVIVDQVGKTRSRARDSETLPPFFLSEYRITDRESSIIRHLSDGKTTKEIGEILFVSHRTVETHAQNIYRKCGVSNRVALINLIDSCRGR